MAIEFFDVLAENIKYNKVEGIDITAESPDWQEVNRLNWAGAVAGIYEAKIAISWSYDTTNRSGCVRFSLDGGNTWTDPSCEEPKDRTDTRRSSYTTIVEKATDGDFEVIVEVSKEGTHVMTVHECLILMKRFG